MIRARFLILRALSAVIWASPPLAADADAPPRLYSQAAYQSPVRADPDDLLLLAGDGLAADDVVVYQASSGEASQRPTGIPAHSSASLGTAPIVSAAGAPYQVIIRMPAEILVRHPYRLWVRN